MSGRKRIMVGSSGPATQTAGQGVRRLAFFGLPCAWQGVLMPVALPAERDAAAAEIQLAAVGEFDTVGTADDDPDARSPLRLRLQARASPMLATAGVCPGWPASRRRAQAPSCSV